MTAGATEDGARRAGARAAWGAATVAVALCALAVAPAGAVRFIGTGADSTQSPRLGAPFAVRDGCVLWRTARAETLVVTGSRAAGEEMRVGRPDSLDRLADLERAVAERRCGAPLWRLALARRLAAAGDTARAEAVLADSALGAGMWAWDALSLASELRAARGDTAGALALLEARAPHGWPDAERAARHARRARFALALGDTARAADLARETLRLFPGAAGSAAAARVLDEMAAARGRPLAPDDERRVASSEALRGAPRAALERLARLRAAAHGEARGRLWLESARLARAARAFDDAHAAAESALGLLPGPGRASALLERARAQRDLGRLEPALSDFAAAAAAESGAAAFQAWWEAGRAAEARGRWRAGAAHYARAAAEPHRRAGEARRRAGLLWRAAGEDDSARAAWERGEDEGSRFWLGVSLRARDRARADSLLAAVAAVPGYTFYRAAARDTLGLGGWPGAVAETGAPGNAEFAAGLAMCTAARTREPESLLGALDLARCAADAGFEGDAERLLSRLMAGDPRLVPEGVEPAPTTWLAAARTAYLAGRPRPAIVLAERALRAAEGCADSLRWTLVPWLYPPAYAEHIAHGPEGLEPALLYALIWQESRFDAAARSSSGALGLGQLMRPTAGDVARWLGEPRPDEAALFEPGRSVRYAARYLRWLLGRFDGNLAVALTAYNAGPGTVPRGWRDVVARGGDALWVELAPSPEAQDYARRIFAVRQAYRELRPAVASR